MKEESVVVRAQEPCESRGGLPGLPVPNKPEDFCGNRAPLKRSVVSRAQGLCEQGDKPGLSFLMPFFPRP